MLESGEEPRGTAPGREEPATFHDPERIVRTCPNCSASLVEHRCKLMCPRCHYYMSCSDYY